MPDHSADLRYLARCAKTIKPRAATPTAAEALAICANGDILDLINVIFGALSGLKPAMSQGPGALERYVDFNRAAGAPIADVLSRG